MAKKVSETEGKIMPHSYEMERNVLGALMVDTKTISRVADIISIDTFYNPAHQLIYKAIFNIFKKGGKIDYLLVSDELKKINKLEDAGGEDYIRQLTDVASISNYYSYAQKIEEKAIGRRIIEHCHAAIASIYEGEQDVTAVAHDLNDNVFKSQISLTAQKIITPDYVGDLLIDEMMFGMTHEGLVGVPCGVKPIDDKTGGWQNQHVITIGARTRHGKSAIAAGYMYNSALIKNPEYGKSPNEKWSLYPSAFMSMEMRNTEVFSRLVSMEIKRVFKRNVSYSAISKGKLSEEDADLVIKAVRQLAQRGIYIDDSPALTTSIIKAKVMKMINEYGIKQVFIDYVQLVTEDRQTKENRAQQISGWYTDFKNQAKLFNIPYIILSQIDRQTEKGGTPRPPALADLKDSGGIEEKSDVVMLLYRAEVNEHEPTDEHGRSLKGTINVNIAKHKQGGTGEFVLPFDVATNSFGDFEDERPFVNPVATRPSFSIGHSINNNSLGSDDQPF
jgi:replicative DNA helicase